MRLAEQRCVVLATITPRCDGLIEADEDTEPRCQVLKAIKDQLDAASWIYNAQFTSKAGEELAKFLIDTSDGAFCKVGIFSGGSEAMEGCIKLARQYWSVRICFRCACLINSIEIRVEVKEP